MKRIIVISFVSILILWGMFYLSDDSSSNSDVDYYNFTVKHSNKTKSYKYEGGTSLSLFKDKVVGDLVAKDFAESVVIISCNYPNESYVNKKGERLKMKLETNEYTIRKINDKFGVSSNHPDGNPDFGSKLDEIIIQIAEHYAAGYRISSEP
jgi:hypothetical protein